MDRTLNRNGKMVSPSRLTPLNIAKWLNMTLKRCQSAEQQNMALYLLQLSLDSDQK